LQNREAVQLPNSANWQRGLALKVALSSRSVVHEAKEYLKGHQLTPEQVENLVERLKKESRFGWARRILVKVREAPIVDSRLRTWSAQQHALCTHKDPDLPVLRALDQALAILEGSFDLASTSDQETLGIGIGDEREAFAGEVVDHGQNAETSTVGECIRQEVQTPALIGRDRQRRPGAECPFASATPADLQPLLAIETSELLAPRGASAPANDGSRTGGGSPPVPASGRARPHRQLARRDSAPMCGLLPGLYTPAVRSPRGGP
jgi:hypothetical protein